ncbi:MurR/RpiR family transcriptional regulator [Streptomyces sp. NPDC057636]|uniref:MurR/RpiR family transcriptional regulator n=1 Tax=Streptomyces sp. NPDC057636 TaxID=3346189 RepID=UPI0036C38992
MTDEGATIAEWLDQRVANVQLGPKATRVRQALTTQPTYCSYATAAEVADRAEVNGATVVRFAQSLGYAGWPQFQEDLRRVYLAHRYDPRQPAEPGGDLIAASLARDAQNLQALERSFDLRTAHTIVQAIRDARHTLVVGSGTHAVAAVALAGLAASRGFPVTHEDRGGPHLANALAGLGPQDCLVAWSFWQHYRQTVAALRIAREAGATTCVITDTRHSPAAQEAAHVLVVPTEGVANLQSMTAATSVAYGLVAELAATDPTASRAAAQRVDTVWREMHLFSEDVPSGGGRSSQPKRINKPAGEGD